jgi:RNA polymerase sigma factor (sigma-70 family)
MKEAENITESTKEIRFEARIKNNILYKAIYGKYGSIKRLCDSTGLLYQHTCRYVNLSYSPYKENGGMRASAVRIAKVLRLDAAELFPQWLYESAIENKVVTELGREEIPALYAHRAVERLSEGVNPKEEAEKVINSEALIESIDELLSPREQGIMKMRFGLTPYNGGRTLEEVGKQFYVTRERIRGIEQRCLEKLRDCEGFNLLFNNAESYED